MQGQLILNAALAKLEAERQNALAVLHLYINTPVGVASHSNVVEEIVNATEQLSKAEGAIRTLQQLVQSSNPEPQSGDPDGTS